MQLLFKRSQARSLFGRPRFQLWAQIELEGDEVQILQRYQFHDAMLVEQDNPELIGKSRLVGMVTALVAFVVLAAFGRWNWQLAAGTSILVGIAGGWFYFDRMRLNIYVNDLIHGRTFKCRSVVDLARREAYLGVVTSFLRQVMETAKHWDGTEALPIAALSAAEAKYVAIRGI